MRKTQIFVILSSTLPVFHDSFLGHMALYHVSWYKMFIHENNNFITLMRFLAKKKYYKKLASLTHLNTKAIPAS